MATADMYSAVLPQCGTAAPNQLLAHTRHVDMELELVAGGSQADSGGESKATSRPAPAIVLLIIIDR